METVDVDNPASPSSRLLYFLVVGIVGGGGVLAFALLPQETAALGPVLALGLIVMIDRVTQRVPKVSYPPRGAFLAYLVVLGLAVTGALVVAGTTARDSAWWLPWLLAGIVFVVVLIGTWIPSERSARQSTK
ncbi:hypothetical protein ACIRCZ_19715 [Leifsonia sp. NPDC102414]|uniref:hypothetical protein n=1 Tax=Leifsonia sp. NPDC102414 TaxID=3364124 RepID=UPI0038291132